MKKNYFLKTMLLTVIMLMGSANVWGQTPNGTLDFGNYASNTPASTANTGFGGVRVGSGGGGFTIQNPGQTIGTLGELRGIAPSTASINSVGITSSEYGPAATTFTISFELYLSGGASGNWYFFAGNGASFGTAQTNGFTSAQVFTGIRWAFGNDGSITTSNRAGTSWTTISGIPFAQNTSYTVTIVGNNSTSTVNYSSYSVGAGKYDLWINNILVGDELSKAQIGNSTDINAFRFYGENSTGNVAEIALDNITWYNTCFLPSSTPTITATPTFNPGAGTYTSAQSVEISTTTPNSTIYYTTDGTTPDNTKTEYSGNISVSTTTTVKAIAYDNNNVLEASDIAEAEYIINLTPTLIVDETTIPVFDVILGNSHAQTITVSGLNLTTDIALVITNDDATAFSVAPASLLPTSGTVNPTSVSVTYNPNSVGTHTAMLTLSSTGATDIVFQLEGIATLATPVAISATDVNQTTATANWNAVAGATGYKVDVYTKEEGEGAELVANGGFEDNFTSWTGQNIASMTVATANPHSGTQYASKTGSDNPRLEQTLDVEIGEKYIFSFWYNNYDASDTNGLKNYTIQGTSGTDYIEGASAPLKLSAVTTWTKYEKEFTATSDKIKISIRAYQAVDIDDVSLAKVEDVPTPIPGSPFTVNDGTTTSLDLTGLSQQTTYYYTVVATDGVNESAVSNEIEFKTGPLTNINEQLTDNFVYAFSGNVILKNATGGQTVEIYNAVGQMLVSKTATDGLNTIAVPTRGVVIVKVSEQVTKVVL